MSAAPIGPIYFTVCLTLFFGISRVGTAYNTTIWGTGTKWGVPGVCFDYRAVRGPKTRQVFAEHGCNVPPVYGDPALLMPYLYDPDVGKEADLCLIPHMDDLLPGRFGWWARHGGPEDLHHRFDRVDRVIDGSFLLRLIDIRTPDAAAFVDLLKSCRRVASGSLHGIILAEAYGIEWSWIRLNGDIFEKDFKYHDFFLSVGIEPASVKVGCTFVLFPGHYQALICEDWGSRLSSQAPRRLTTC